MFKSKCRYVDVYCGGFSVQEEKRTTRREKDQEAKISGLRGDFILERSKKKKKKELDSRSSRTMMKVFYKLH